MVKYINTVEGLSEALKMEKVEDKKTLTKYYLGALYTFEDVKAVALEYEANPEKFKDIESEIMPVISFYHVAQNIQDLEAKNPGTYLVHFGKLSRTGQSQKAKVYYINGRENWDLTQWVGYLKGTGCNTCSGRYFESCDGARIAKLVGVPMSNLVKIENI